jgi:hypothetical protein
MALAEETFSRIALLPTSGNNRLSEDALVKEIHY